VLVRPFSLDGREVFVTGSIGIALGVLGNGAPGLLRDADTAMARAKAHGANRWEVFDEAIRTEVIARMEVHNGLRLALDRHELRVVYQPEVELATGRIIGVEALVRWQHPERGVVSPAAFIPAAEETGLILPIGAYVLREACSQAARWQELFGGEPVTVWVNLSGRQLSQWDLPEMVADAIATSGVRPRSIGLEITESVVMEDAEQASESLRRLRGLGLCLAIDDFGTGYSSLSYLKRFPVDLLKVDRSFVDGIVTDPDDASIVAAVISLARALGKGVVAEGVENERQVDALLAMGCSLAQGFHFARPQSAEDLTELLRRQRPGVLAPLAVGH
jgi:EAL domain-containing protein (putative c-di-GMP-specific phosphodiesterase class I)